MILFFYGEDNFRLKQKIKKLKEKFISSSLGDINLSILDGKSITFDEFVRQVLAMPFLANSRLVIVENLMRASKKTNKGEISSKNADIQEKIIALLPKVPENTVLVFLEEGIPDRRTALFKKLAQPKKFEEFKLLEGLALEEWIRSEIEARGGEINLLAIQKLAEYVGNDLWRMTNEIDKLISYSKIVTVKEIELFIKAQVESNIFNLTDSIASRNSKQALKELHKLLDNGEAELYLLSMIVSQFRNLLIAKDLSDRSGGKLSQWDLAKTAGMHPFVAQKTIWQIKNYKLEELKQIYDKLLECDLKVKTGQLEPKTALDLLIIKLVS